MTTTQRPPVDQDVRDRIVTELDRNACIEAGAGTGKTSVLTDRIVELLRREVVAVEQLAVITFTERAAAELSVRVRQKLEARVMRAESGSDEEAALRRALGDLHRARIETIHAFAGGLLRERPVEAGLDPQFEIVDQLGAQLDFDRAYDAWLDALLAGADPAVGRALNRLMGPSHFRGLAEALNEHRDVLPLAPVTAPAPDVAGYLGALDETVQDLVDLREQYDLPDADEGVQNLPDVERFIARVQAARASPEDLERMLVGAPAFKVKGAQRHWDDREGCRRLKVAVTRLRDANVVVRDELRTEALVGMLPLVEEFVTAFADERRRMGRVTFDDLLLWARDLVVVHPDVREDFRAQYRAILVDEFQDTDPVQAELVLHLASDGPELDPGALRPAPGRLVVVGDPKQSIYRFRRADIAVYDAVKHGPLADDLRQIRQNFRSADGIIAWSNALFDRVLVAVPGVQPANVPLAPSGFTVDQDRPPVVVAHGADADAEPQEAGLHPRVQEARTLAAVLARAHGEGWPVRDRESRRERAATWRDMAVLVPARTGVDVYEEAFAAAGVPLRHEGGKTFFRRQEVRELCSCLLAIDDPTDAISLVATLRSPVFGCSDDDLVRWSAVGGRWSYLGGLVDGDGGADTVRAGMLLLRELYRARAGLSLPELVRRVLEDTGAVEHALTRLDGRETSANLLKLVDQASDFSATGGGGLRAFTRWLARNRDEDSEETDAGVSEETDDVVRLLTIHAAKGLEFPIVALANLSSSGSNQFRPIPDARAHRLHMRVGVAAKGGWYATPGLEAAKDDEQRFVDAERLRLLYVAVTRARDHLVLPWIGQPRGLLAAMADSLPRVDDTPERAAELGVHVIDRASLTLPDEAPPQITDDALLPDTELDVALEEADAWALERAALLTGASVELALSAATSLEKPWRPVAVSAESPDATLILGEGPPLPLGDAVHRVMQLVDFPGAANLEDVLRAVCAEGELEEHADEVRSLVERCLESPSVVAAFTADRVIRELAFTIPGPGGDGFVTGRIDLLYRVGDAWTVVDYKTDVVDGDLATAAAAHEAQVSAYVEAVRAVCGVEPRVVLVFARAGGEAVVVGKSGDGGTAPSLSC